jgi:hypothetical protein
MSAPSRKVYRVPIATTTDCGACRAARRGRFPSPPVAPASWLLVRPYSTTMELSRPCCSHHARHYPVWTLSPAAVEVER